MSFQVNFFKDKTDDNDCIHLFSCYHSAIPHVDQDIWYTEHPPKKNIAHHYKVTRVDHSYYDCGQVDGPSYNAEVYLKEVKS